MSQEGKFYAQAAQQPERRISAFGIGSVVAGGLAFLICWVPFVGVITLPVSAIGVLLAVVGMLLSLTKKDTGLGLPIAGLVVSGVALIVGLGNLAGSSAVAQGLNEVAKASEKDRATRQTVVGEEPEAGAQAAPNSPSAPQIQWAPADKPVEQDGVRVQITSVRVGKVKVRGMNGAKESAEDFLQIGIQIVNVNPNKKVTYTGWGETSVSFLPDDLAKLKDNFGNSYSHAVFGTLSRPVGMVIQESLYPQKPLDDFMVFEVPLDTVEFLQLELPAAKFGGEGMLRFQIPARMIQR